LTYNYKHSSAGDI